MCLGLAGTGAVHGMMCDYEDSLYLDRQVSDGRSCISRDCVVCSVVAFTLLVVHVSVNVRGVRLPGRRDLR